MLKKPVEVLPESPIGKAVTYARNQQVALARFLDDGRLRLDNNCRERELRRRGCRSQELALVGSDHGAKGNATFVCLIANCQQHELEPWAYFRDLFCLVPERISRTNASWPRPPLRELPKHPLSAHNAKRHGRCGGIAEYRLSFEGEELAFRGAATRRIWSFTDRYRAPLTVYLPSPESRARVKALILIANEPNNWDLDHNGVYILVPMR